jgi:hypothetical protein
MAMIATMMIIHSVPTSADLMPARSGNLDGKLSMNCQSSQPIPSIVTRTSSTASSNTLDQVMAAHSSRNNLALR